MEFEHGVPISVFSGFLGSGKTSILNYLLQQQHEKKVAVIVNEFGKISLDHQFIEHEDENTIQLANGCVCCTVRKGLIEVLKQLVTRGPWDGIMIEASGVADLGPLVQALLVPEIESWARIDAIITVVHGELCHDHMQQTPIVERQIRGADILVVSHRDLISDRQWQLLQERLRKLNPGAVIVVSDHGQVPVTALFSPQINEVGRNDLQRSTAVGHSFQTVSVSSQGALAIKNVEQWLAELPEQGVIRAKGIVLSPDAKHGLMVHLVGQRITIDPLPANHRDWKAIGTQLVLIGQGLDEQDLRASFAACNGQARRFKWPWKR